MYKPKYFVIKELVNPSILKKVPESILWQMFDDRLLKCADLIREKYGSCTVNASGLTDCGLRDWTSKTGAKYSAHKFGRALDIHIKTIELKYVGNKAEKTKAYEKIREELLKDKRFDCLNFERDVSWLHCIDKDTEILTNNGWKNCFNIANTDKAINFNLETRKLEVQKINQIIKRQENGFMYRIGGRSGQCLVTKEHKLLVKTKDVDKFRFETAEYMYNHQNRWLKIPVCGLLEGNKQHNIELLKLCIATICDGYIHHKQSGRGNIVFHINKERKVIELERLLNILNIPYKKTIYDKSVVGTENYTYYIPTKESQQIIQIITKEKKLPWNFVFLPIEDKKSLLKEWAIFDGCTKHTHIILDNTDEFNIDVLQTMAVTSGLFCSKSISTKKRIYVPCFRLVISNKQTIGTYKSIKKEKYNGLVWCVNTDNHTIIIRKNGHCMIIGNCDTYNRQNRIFNP